jgi:hypothetical protein
MALTHLGVVDLGVGTSSPYDCVSDPSGVFAYVACGLAPGKIVKFNLSTLAVVDTLSMAGGEGLVRALAIDSTGTYLYAVIYSIAGKVVRVRLSDFTRVDDLALGAGYDAGQTCALDDVNDLLYIGHRKVAAKLSCVNVSTMAVSWQAGLAAGLNNAQGIALDVPNGVGYVGLEINPAKVVKFSLADGSNLGECAMAANENVAWSCSLDQGNQILYMGLGNTVSEVTKVDVAAMAKLAGLNFSGGADGGRAACIHLGSGSGWAGTSQSPLRCVRFSLSGFSQEAVLSANAGENLCVRISLVPSSSKILISCGVDPGKVVVFHDTALIPGGSQYLPILGVG